MSDTVLLQPICESCGLYLDEFESEVVQAIRESMRIDGIWEYSIIDEKFLFVFYVPKSAECDCD